METFSVSKENFFYFHLETSYTTKEVTHVLCAGLVSFQQIRSLKSSASGCEQRAKNSVLCAQRVEVLQPGSPNDILYLPLRFPSYQHQ